MLKTGAPSLRNQAGSRSKPVAVGRSVSRNLNTHHLTVILNSVQVVQFFCCFSIDTIGVSTRELWRFGPPVFLPRGPDKGTADTTLASLSDFLDFSC